MDSKDIIQEAVSSVSSKMPQETESKMPQETESETTLTENDEGILPEIEAIIQQETQS